MDFFSALHFGPLPALQFISMVWTSFQPYNYNVFQ